MTYLSFIEQTLHYFDRPHRGAPDQIIEHPSAWRGCELPPLDEMAYQLVPPEVDEVCSAVSSAVAMQKPCGELTASDFPLPRLASRIREWRHQLADGLGFQVVRGIPVERWSPAEAQVFFWCFGLHVGRPGAQNPDGDLLGHVIDTGDSRQDDSVRLYKTSANIDYHCDAADVVGLLCLHKAREGGHSRIVSSVSVFNELLRRRPDLAARLFQPLLLDIRDREVNSAGSSLPVQPCCYAGGSLRTFYHADYFRSVVRHADVPPLSAHTQELLDTYESIALEPGMCLDMDLQPGDIQLLSNHSIVHARTGYVDFDDLDRRRHLLRLWLSL